MKPLKRISSSFQKVKLSTIDIVKKTLFHKNYKILELNKINGIPVEEVDDWAYILLRTDYGHPMTQWPYVKFIHSEKATKFCEISTNYLTGSK